MSVIRLQQTRQPAARLAHVTISPEQQSEPP